MGMVMAIVKCQDFLERVHENQSNDSEQNDDDAENGDIGHETPTRPISSRAISVSDLPSRRTRIAG